MADQRDRSLEIIEFLTSEGIVVNIGKNKAQGNKGFFKATGKCYRIDVAKGLKEEEIIRVLLHEFAHYVHYKYDKTLKKIDFIIQDLTDDILEEMIELTVDLVPREDAKKLFAQKELINSEIKTLSKALKKIYPDFKLSVQHKYIEQLIRKKGYYYLLKHDRVKVLRGFSVKMLSVENVDNYFTSDEEALKQYIKLKSKQRVLKRINSRINKLNKYYNSLTELFARSIEIYFMQKEIFKSKAPKLKKIYDRTILSNNIPLLSKCLEFFT